LAFSETSGVPRRESRSDGTEFRGLDVQPLKPERRLTIRANSLLLWGGAAAERRGETLRHPVGSKSGTTHLLLTAAIFHPNQHRDRGGREGEIERERERETERERERQRGRESTSLTRGISYLELTKITNKRERG